MTRASITEKQDIVLLCILSQFGVGQIWLGIVWLWFGMDEFGLVQLMIEFSLVGDEFVLVWMSLVWCG